MSEVLDAWEKDISEGGGLLEDHEKDGRILALIDLVRKKDEALRFSYNATFLLMKRVTKLGEIKGEPGSPIEGGWQACDKMMKALSLTNELGGSGE